MQTQSRKRAHLNEWPVPPPLQKSGSETRLVESIPSGSSSTDTTSHGSHSSKKLPPLPIIELCPPAPKNLTENTKRTGHRLFPPPAPLRRGGSSSRSSDVLPDEDKSVWMDDSKADSADALLSISSRSSRAWKQVQGGFKHRLPKEKEEKPKREPPSPWPPTGTPFERDQLRRRAKESDVFRLKVLDVFGFR